MSKLGVVTAIAAVSLIAATMTAIPSYAAQKRATLVRSHAYDGLWSVLIHTQGGPCDASARYPARIVGGQVLQADDDFSYRISGAVVASGAILVTVNRGGQSATGYGRLRGGTGNGRWSIGGNQCYGTWVAMRRAAN